MKINNMNIFFLHIDPKTCAEMHVDKHVVKMILELAQLLCSAHHLSNSEYEPPYKLTHKNHPSAIWTRSSKSNYRWLVSLAKELCKEYTYRYEKIHKTEKYIDDLAQNIPPLPDTDFTQPLQAMPDEYKEKDSIDAYRNYYFYAKKHLHTWKKREKPQWLDEYLD
jgi:hypothetical protein